MAKLLVSMEVIRSALFPNSLLEIKSIETWDSLNTMTVAVELDGSDVPECDWVECTITKQYETASFSEIGEPFGKCLARRVKD